MLFRSKRMIASFLVVALLLQSANLPTLSVLAASSSAEWEVELEELDEVEEEQSDEQIQE